MRSHQRGGKDLAWVSAVGGGFDDQGAVTGIADRPDQDERAVRTEVLLMETEHPGRFATPAEHPMTQTIPVHGEHPDPHAMVKTGRTAPIHRGHRIRTRPG